MSEPRYVAHVPNCSDDTIVNTVMRMPRRMRLVYMHCSVPATIGDLCRRTKLDLTIVCQCLTKLQNMGLVSNTLYTIQRSNLTHKSFTDTQSPRLQGYLSDSLARTQLGPRRRVILTSAERAELRRDKQLAYMAMLVLRYYITGHMF